MLSKEHLLCARLCSIVFMYRPFQFSQLPSGVGDDPISEMRTLRYLLSEWQSGDRNQTHLTTELLITALYQVIRSEGEEGTWAAGVQGRE